VIRAKKGELIQHQWRGEKLGLVFIKGPLNARDMWGKMVGRMGKKKKKVQKRLLLSLRGNEKTGAEKKVIANHLPRPSAPKSKE